MPRNKKSIPEGEQHSPDVKILEKKGELIAAFLKNNDIDYVMRQVNDTWMIIVRFNQFCQVRINTETFNFSEDIMTIFKKMSKKANELMALDIELRKHL